MPKGTCVFNVSWLKETRYKTWLRVGSSNQFAKYHHCKKEIKVTCGVEAALKRHSDGKLHKQLVAEFENSAKSLSTLYFKPTSSSTSSDTVVPSSPTCSSTKNESVLVPLKSIMFEDLV